MLVIISDLHLTDGTSGETITEGAFRVFRERLRDMAYDASWRADKTYKPITELHIVLLGDILDLIRSTQWPPEKSDPGYVRPWDDPQSAKFIGKIRSIADGVLQHNAGSLSVLKSLTNPRAITLPPATPEGQAKQVSRDPGSSDRVPVNVSLHYLVGNHDWFLHLPGKEYDAIRQKVIDTIGLKNGPGPFPHDPGEDPALGALYQQHKLFARHGDIYDPMNYEGTRNASSLGDAIVTDIVDRFAVEVKKTCGAALPDAVVEGLKEIDNVRPMLLIPAWIDGLLRQTCPAEAQRTAVKNVWDKLVTDFLSLDFVRQHPFGLVVPLRFGLRLSQGLAFRAFASFVTWLNKLSKGSESYSSFALKEQAFLNRAARCIVYGHTHHFEIQPLEAAGEGDDSSDQIYINSGTWRAVHDQALANPKQHEFVGYKVMTYLAFFKDGERDGQFFESWTGGLTIE